MKKKLLKSGRQLKVENNSTEVGILRQGVKNGLVKPFLERDSRAL